MAEIHWPRQDWWNVVPVMQEAEKAAEQGAARSRRIINRWPDWTQSRAELYFGGSQLGGISAIGAFGAAAKSEVYRFQHAFVLLRAEKLAGGGAITEAHLLAAVKAAFPKSGEDGKWGNETRTEMNTFQSVMGLTKTDKPEPATVLRLNMRLGERNITGAGVDYTKLIMEVGLIEPGKSVTETTPPPVTPPPVAIVPFMEPSVWQKVKDKFAVIGWQKAVLVGGAALVVAGVVAVILTYKKK